MTLSLSIDIQQSKDCKNFYFFDSTPPWNALSAPNGYDLTGSNGINPSVISMSDTVLVITKPDGTVVTIDFVNGDKSTSRLTTDGRNLVEKTITYSDLGYASKLADGIYKFQYLPYNDSNGYTYSSTCYVVQDCQICCCLDSRLSDISLPTDCVDCDNERKIKKLWNLYLQRDAARMAAACNNYTGAQEIIDFIISECNITDCTNC